MLPELLHHLRGLRTRDVLHHLAVEEVDRALGVLGVWLMIRQNVWGWPVGLVQVTVSAWVFFGSKLYSDVILQGCFFAIQASTMSCVTGAEPSSAFWCGPGSSSSLPGSTTRDSAPALHVHCWFVNSRIPP